MTTTNHSGEELKPCPFCGGDAKEIVGLVGCEHCAIARRDAQSWNRRATACGEDAANGAAAEREAFDAWNDAQDALEFEDAEAEAHALFIFRGGWKAARAALTAEKAAQEPVAQILADESDGAWAAFEKSPHAGMSNYEDLWPVWSEAWEAARAAHANQCDGCNANAPLSARGNHVMPDGGYVGCTKGRYAQSMTDAARDETLHALRVARAEIQREINDTGSKHAEVSKRALKRWHAAIDAEIERIDERAQARVAPPNDMQISFEPDDTLTATRRRRNDAE